MKKIALRWLFLTGQISLMISSAAQAQISEDGTLPTKVRQAGEVFEITGGSRAGNNLFHSFEEFSVPTNTTAFFNNASDLANIISRVTGGSLSNIDGLIRANGGANFILLNPNGIAFGSNARLDIGGSFLGSTATSLQFADGTEFAAADGLPLITVSVPVGLQMEPSGGAIQVQGPGHNLSVAPNGGPLVKKPLEPRTGLQVRPGQTFALVGNDLSLEGGILQAAGQIELGSVRDGQVILNPAIASAGWTLEYEGASFGDIELGSASLLEAGGSIHLQGARVLLSEGSTLLIQNVAQEAGSVRINATESVEISGYTPDERSVSTVATETFGGSKGADIAISTGRFIQEGGLTYTATYGEAESGAVSVEATESVRLRGNASPAVPTFEESAIGTLTVGSGAAGDVSLSTPQLTVQEGARLVSFAVGGSGNGGNVDVEAAEILISGASPLINASFDSINGSFIGTTTLALGKGGDVTVSSDTLTLTEGGSINTSTQGTGTGGDVTVNARTTRLEGFNQLDPLLRGSIISALTLDPGDGGNVSLTTDQLIITDGAQVSTQDFFRVVDGTPVVATGNAGMVEVNARESIEVFGVNPKAPDLPSGLYSLIFGRGRSGDVSVSTERLSIRDGGLVGTGVLRSSVTIGSPSAGSGTGQGGDVAVNAERIEVEGASPTTSSSFGLGRFGSRPSGLGTFTFGTGNAGSATINTAELVVRDGANVTSITFAQGNAGKLIIDASESILVSGADAQTGSPAEISASTSLAGEELQNDLFVPEVPTGNTGELEIRTDRLTVSDGGGIAVRHDGTGAAGELLIEANSILVDNEASINASTQSGQGGNITIAAEDVVWRRNSETTATAGGTGSGGNIFIEADTLVALEDSDITANASQEMGGNIQIAAQGIFLCSTCEVDASSEQGVDGEVELVSPETEASLEFLEVPQEVISSEQVVAIACPANGDSSSLFTITGRGGLPPRPGEPLNPQALVAFEALEQASSHPNLDSHSSELPPPAQGWYVNAQGTIILASQAPTATRGGSELIPPNCHTP